MGTSGANADRFRFFFFASCRSNEVGCVSFLSFRFSLLSQVSFLLSFLQICMYWMCFYKYNPVNYTCPPPLFGIPAMPKWRRSAMWAIRETRKFRAWLCGVLCHGVIVAWERRPIRLRCCVTRSFAGNGTSGGSNRLTGYFRIFMRFRAILVPCTIRLISLQCLSPDSQIPSRDASPHALLSLRNRSRLMLPSFGPLHTMIQCIPS
jgi:hypothetical protein